MLINRDGSSEAFALPASEKAFCPPRKRLFVVVFFVFSAGEGRDLGFDPSVMRNPYLQMRLAFRSGLLETV